MGADIKIDFNCSFDSINEIFNLNEHIARKHLSNSSFEEYCKNALFLSKIGQGDKPAIAFLKVMPYVGEFYGDGYIDKITKFSYNELTKSPNKHSLELFFQSFISVIEHTTKEQLDEYLNLITDFLSKTTISIHGIHLTHPSPSFQELLKNIDILLEQLSFDGIRAWIDYGLRYFQDHPQRQEEFFSLSTPDSKAAFARQRDGVLFIDVENTMDYIQESLFNKKFGYSPYSPNFEKLQHFKPYFEDNIIRLPDLYDDLYINDKTISPHYRYFALISHMIAHDRYTTSTIADNLSAHQRVFIEVFEDARVEFLLCKQYPGIKKHFLSLIPKLDEKCDDKNQSCLRHRAILLSRRLCDENYECENEYINTISKEFIQLLNDKESSTNDSVNFGLKFFAKTKTNSDSFADLYFENTNITYRDDNRHMWTFIEAEDEGESIFDNTSSSSNDEEDDQPLLLPHYYDEYDYANNSYKLDWVTVYEKLINQSSPDKINKILEKNAHLIKQIKKVLDLLKPQNKKRVRYQEEGSELDLDVAIKSIIDLKNNTNPDTRINISHEHDSRSVSVLILIDLSQSLNDTIKGTNSTILQLSQEAVTILSWAIEQLGDKFAIAGFNSNTREHVFYYHIKGFDEKFDDDVKSRLSSLEANYSTRMGAAIRHASHYLQKQKSDKKLMLVLTDGEPADVDIADERALIEDTHKAMQESHQVGIYPYCISLDRKADSYIKDIFLNHYIIIDKIENLPKELPRVFVNLTK